MQHRLLPLRAEPPPPLVFKEPIFKSGPRKVDGIAAWLDKVRLLCLGLRKLRRTTPLLPTLCSSHSLSKAPRRHGSSVRHPCSARSAWLLLPSLQTRRRSQRRQSRVRCSLLAAAPP